MTRTSEARVESYRRVLGLGTDATPETVRINYRGRMRRAHPDAGGNEEKAKALNEARDFFVANPERIAPPATPTATRTAPQPQPQPRPTPRTAPTPRTPPAPRPTPRPAQTPAPTPATPSAAVAATVPTTPPSNSGGLTAAASGGWVVFNGAVRVLSYLVVAYFALIAVALVGWLLTAGLPWLRGIIAIAWPS